MRRVLARLHGQPPTAKGRPMTNAHRGREYARTNPKHWINLTAEDIPPGWIDDMVKRLFEELNRQLLRFEKTGSTDPVDVEAGNASGPAQTGERGDEKSIAAAREQDARTLARLQASLERLTKMEMDRASLRATKSSRTRGETRAQIQSDVLARHESGRTRGEGGETR
jgi:hypothetical protein